MRHVQLFSLGGVYPLRSPSSPLQDPKSFHPSATCCLDMEATEVFGIHPVFSKDRFTRRPVDHQCRTVRFRSDTPVGR